MNYTKAARAAALRSARITADVQQQINSRAYYQFQYTPLSGPLPGLGFEQQTEDAINDIGNAAYGSSEISKEALQTAQQAYNAAQSAIEIANHAETSAQTAQTTADNAATAAANAQTAADSATATAATAQQQANQAISDAATAQNTADTAVVTANAANENAENAVSTAEAAAAAANVANAKLDVVEPIALELSAYSNIIEIVDYNTMLTFARKYLNNAANTNGPIAGAGWLDVDEDVDEATIRQKFIAASDGAMYIRFGTVEPDSDPTTIQSWSEWVRYAIGSDVTGAVDTATAALTTQIGAVQTALDTHEADHNNPHQVTAEQLGLASAYKYKGSKATYADLPTTGNEAGDVWNIETADPDHDIKAGDNVGWTGTEWDVLGGNVDLSALTAAVEAAQTTADDAKTDAATAQTAAQTAQTTADAALPKTGGTISGDLVLDGEPRTIGNERISLVFQKTGATAFSINAYYQQEENVGFVFKNKNDDLVFLNITSAEATDGVFIHGLETPLLDTDAANKKYVDDAVAAGGGGGSGDVTAAGNNDFTGQNTFQGAKILADSATNSIAIGKDNVVGGANSTIYGANVSGDGLWACAFGYLAQADKTHGLAFGTAATASGDNATAVGVNSVAGGTDSLAFGETAVATANYGIAIGRGATAEGINSTAIGVSAHASGDYAFAMGQDARAVGDESITIGNAARAANDNAVALGNNAVTSADNQVSIGVYNTASDRWTKRKSIAGVHDIDMNGAITGDALTIGNGVIKSGNTAQTTSIQGAVEPTLASVLSTGGTVAASSSVNCYTIDCLTNSATAFTMDCSHIGWIALSGGDAPLEMRILTIVITTGATAPVVTWTFPAGKTVNYPGGVAPVFTANATCVVNVIVLADATGITSIQVTDPVSYGRA